VTDAPPEPPATFRASIIVAPLAFLAGGAVIAHLAGEEAASAPSTGWINLSSLAYVLAWMVYGVCAAGFLWVDRTFVSRLPGRTWPSAGRMLAATAGAAALGAMMGLIAGAVLGGALAFLGSRSGGAASESLLVLYVAAIPLSGVVGLILDLKTRSSARIRLQSNLSSEGSNHLLRGG
jgi:hypothetical protein